MNSAWRRGSRHLKNKVQEIQAAINPIVFKHKSTVCFKGAILEGDFTKPSIQQLESDNYSVLYFPTALFVKTFKKFNLDIISTDTALESEFKRRIDLWENFQKKDELFKELLKSNKQAVLYFLSSLLWKQNGNSLIIKKDFKMPVEEVPVLGFKIKLK